MKRLLAFLFISIMAFCLQPCKENKLFDNDNIDKICIVSNCQLKFDKKIISGNQFYYELDRSQAKDCFKKDRDKIDGVVLYFNDASKLNEIIDYYQITYYSGLDVENYNMYYGYSPMFNESYNLNNKRLNVQIAASENRIIVGFPAILTGF